MALALLTVCLLSLCACSKRYSDLPAFSPIPFRDYPNESVGRFKTSYLADQIDSYYRGTDPGPIGVTTLVNLDDLYNTSTFGRIYTEQLMSELAMRGYQVIELRHTDALQFLNNTGEFALSRDMTSVRHERDLGAIIVGTYVASPVRVYVNARLLDPNTSSVLSAGSVEMAKTTEIARLMRQGGVMTALERIPVRHIGLSTYPMPSMPNPMSRVYDLEETLPLRPSLQLPAGEGAKKGGKGH
jgi:TolB-like protein